MSWMQQDRGEGTLPKPWWHAVARPLRDRRILGWTLGLLLAACAVVTVVVALIVWTSSMTLDQRIAGIAATFTVGAFTLAVVGAAVALLAYRLSLQRPKLQVHITTADLDAGTIRIGMLRPDESGERRVVLLPGYRRHGETLALRISLENTSDWSARNVAVRVDVRGLRRLAHVPSWTIAAYHPYVTNEVVALQWEGGADYAVHGNWTRELPELHLNNAIVEAPGAECSMIIDVAAEGFRHRWTFPIRPETVDDHPDSTRGAIVGYCGYPSSGVPPLQVYAIPVERHRRARYINTVVGPGYRWFWIGGLEPGTYRVIAYRPDSPNLRGAYTAGARDDDLTATMDHKLVDVEVKAGGLTEGIAITDWYAADLLPDRPRLADSG
jgi:hypothetical protein